MRVLARCRWGLCALLLLACGGGQAPDTVASPGAASTASKPKLPKGSWDRDDVVAIVNRGVGSFLQRVQVEASLAQGRFQGFRVQSLQPENFWRDVDLQPGDVVVAVNGQSMEKESAAFEVFESLRTVNKVSVSLVRNGKPRQLVFRIVGAPQPATSEAAQGMGGTSTGDHESENVKSPPPKPGKPDSKKPSTKPPKK